MYTRGGSSPLYRIRCLGEKVLDIQGLFSLHSQEESPLQSCGVFRVQLTDAIRTNIMGELQRQLLQQETFNGHPLLAAVADRFAGGADRNKRLGVLLVQTQRLDRSDRLNRLTCDNRANILQRENDSLICCRILMDQRKGIYTESSAAFGRSL